VLKNALVALFCGKRNLVAVDFGSKWKEFNATKLSLKESKTSAFLGTRYYAVSNIIDDLKGALSGKITYEQCLGIIKMCRGLIGGIGKTTKVKKTADTKDLITIDGANIFCNVDASSSNESLWEIATNAAKKMVQDYEPSGKKK
jgi:hypothetical protein